MGFNSAFKGLIYLSHILRNLRSRKRRQIKQWPQTIFYLQTETIQTSFARLDFGKSFSNLKSEAAVLFFRPLQP